MTDDADFIRRGFVSERRSLLVTSFLLFFYQAAGIEIDKINVLGNEAKISDSSWVPIALWTLWVYFAVRYYQYFRHVPDKGFMAAYQRRLDQLTRQLAARRFRRVFRREEEFPEEELKRLNVSLAFGPIDPVIESQPSRLLVRATVSFLRGTQLVESRNSKKIIELSWKELLLPKVRACLHVLLSTRLVTEYVLPFLVSLLPLVYWVMKR